MLFCTRPIIIFGIYCRFTRVACGSGETAAIQTFAVPKKVKDVRRFVGLVSWYRRFIPNFSSIIRPLTNLTRKSIPFKRNVEAVAAVTKLKSCLSNAPVMAFSDFSRPFIIQTNACSEALGTVLTQESIEGENAVVYASSILSNSEKNDSASEIEMAVVWAIEKFRGYVQGSKFTVITDHSALVWLNKLKEPKVG